MPVLTLPRASVFDILLSDAHAAGVSDGAPVPGRIGDAGDFGFCGAVLLRQGPGGWPGEEAFF